jgi:protein TonB
VQAELEKSKAAKTPPPAAPSPATAAKTSAAAAPPPASSPAAPAAAPPVTPAASRPPAAEGSTPAPPAAPPVEAAPAAASPPAAGTAAAGTAATERAAGAPRTVTEPPKLVSSVKPEYPPLARKLRVEGVVVVSVKVDENGHVEEAQLTESIDQNVGINEAALAVARAARFKPATRDGVPIAMWTRLRIPFKLQQ